MEGDFKHVKQVQPSNDDDPLPNETPILLLSFSLMGMAFLTSVSVIMKSKCLQREREKERKREREREIERERDVYNASWFALTENYRTDSLNIPLLMCAINIKSN